VAFAHLAHVDKLLAAGARLRGITISGGGARSPVWPQMIADVLGLPVEIPDGGEYGACGAALLAGTGIGWYPSIGDASRRVRRVRRTHRPDPALREAYEAAWRRYGGHRDALLRMPAPMSDLS